MCAFDEATHILFRSNKNVYYCEKLLQLDNYQTVSKHPVIQEIPGDYYCRVENLAIFVKTLLFPIFIFLPKK
jgi:hypothetical protein